MLSAAAMSSIKMAAEIGVAFLCADLGITPQTRDDHRLYLVMAESPERRQAGDLHRRQSRAEGR